MPSTADPFFAAPPMVEVAAGELAGAALAWAVAEAEGRKPILLPPTYGLPARVAVREAGRLIAWRPERDWSQAGPLLDQWCKGFGMVQDPAHKGFRAFAYGREPFQRLQGGPTLLVAACRARVVVMLGDVVRVPAELVA